MPTPIKPGTIFDYTTLRWKEAEMAVKSCAYKEQLENYQPGWVMYTDFTKSFLELPTDKDLVEFADAGCGYIVFYKPGIFPTELDRANALTRYKAWVQRNFKIKEEDFVTWLENWEATTRKTIERCHSKKIKVLLQASNAFNIGAHVYNENWFSSSKPTYWETKAAEYPIPEVLKGGEEDLISPAHASEDYRTYCKVVVEELISRFDLDGLYYDDNGSDLDLLEATVDVAHANDLIVMNHHSADDMGDRHFSLPDYWLTGESAQFRDPYEYFRRRQSRAGHFLNCVAITNEIWNADTGSVEATTEEIGFGFLMCALKFPVLYPAVPDAKKLWSRFLPLYTQVVKPRTRAFVWVTDCSYVKATPNQFLPMPAGPPRRPELELGRVFYSVFANDAIYLVIANSRLIESKIMLNETFMDLETGEDLTEASLKPGSVRILVKA